MPKLYPKKYWAHELRDLHFYTFMCVVFVILVLLSPLHTGLKAAPRFHPGVFSFFFYSNTKPRLLETCNPENIWQICQPPKSTRYICHLKKIFDYLLITLYLSTPWAQRRGRGEVQQGKIHRSQVRGEEEGAVVDHKQDAERKDRLEVFFKGERHLKIIIRLQRWRIELRYI